MKKKANSDQQISKHYSELKLEGFSIGDTLRSIHGEVYDVVGFDTSYGLFDQDEIFFDHTNDCLVLLLRGVHGNPYKKRAHFIATRDWWKVNEGDKGYVPVIPKNKLFSEYIRNNITKEEFLRAPEKTLPVIDIEVPKKGEVIVEELKEGQQLSLF